MEILEYWNTGILENSNIPIFPGKYWNIGILESGEFHYLLEYLNTGVLENSNIPTFTEEISIGNIGILG